MILRRQLLVSFGVQGAGAAAVLLATILLGAALGPEVQGGFSRAKAEIEFIAAFATFGLPQALFYFVKSGRLALRQALRWTWGCAVLAIPLAGLYAVWLHGAQPAATIFWIGLAASAAVAYGPLRALLLVGERTAWFNAMTALPQVLVLAGVLYLIARAPFPASAWPVLFAAAFAGSALWCWWRLRAAHAPDNDSSIGWRDLGHYGAAAWLSAGMTTAAILLVQHWVEQRQGAAALGRFSMAMTLAQVPLTPISYAAPLLFRRWMEQSGARASQRAAGMVFLLMLVAAGVVAAVAGVWPDVGLGANYPDVAVALAVLLVGVAAEAASRVMTVQASAAGLPWIAVRAEAVRWGTLFLCAVFVPTPDVLSVCGVWAVGAWAAALVFVWQARRSAARSL